MDDEDVESRIAGGLIFLFGGWLCVWAWQAAVGEGKYAVEPAVLGPTFLMLGVGLLIHGKGIPTFAVSRLTRAYGIAGSTLTLVFLYFVGFFDRPAPNRSLWVFESAVPFVLLAFWMLPSRFHGGRPSSWK